jgi:hypothetical protein
MADVLACQVAGPQCVSLLTTRLPRIACCASQTYQVNELGEEESLALLSSYAPPGLPRYLDTHPGSLAFFNDRQQ